MRRRERGSLEAAVLGWLWQAEGPLTAAELRHCFEEAERPAHTTVLTVLDRLIAKDLVRREASQGGARFAATHSESEETATTMRRALEQSGDRATALMHFAGQLGDDEVAALRRALGVEIESTR